MDKKPEAQPTPQGKVQGEGDYDAARRYRKEVGDFVAHADVDKIAHEAAPQSAAEARDLALAEDSGRSRSKGDDPKDAAEMARGQNRAVKDKDKSR